MIAIVLVMMAGQCCGGPCEISAESANGRFRVVATPMGRQAHRPCVLRMRWMESGAHGWREQSAFDVCIDAPGCFNPGLTVSPAGNGFLLQWGESTFFGRDGRVWGSWKGVGHAFCLALGAPVTDELRAEVRALLDRRPADASVQALVGQLASDDLEERDAARVELTRRGVDAIETLLESPNVEARAIVDRVPRWAWLLGKRGRLEEAAAELNR